MKYLIFLLIFTVLAVDETFTWDDDEPTSSHTHPYGRPLNLMRFDEKENIILDLESLNATFLNSEVKDRKIIAVSVIGAFRKGKSFLMDYALRYMYANYKSVAFLNNPLSNKQDWIGDENEPLRGFSWRGGAARDTSGVVLWSDVFLHDLIDIKTKKVEKVAIILLDTQGLFDSKTSPTDNSRIFALGTLISSVQIFNLNDVIQENQLEYLQMATSFAKFAMSSNRKKRGQSKPFQTLIFLMRDWQNHEEFAYGQSGGSMYLNRVLRIESSQPEPLQEVRRDITKTFEQTLCYLLPHPGPRIINNNEYDGRLCELDEEFRMQLKEFLEWLLQSRNLKKKKILGNEVTGGEYAEYMKMYFEEFQSGNISKVETLHALTVRTQYEINLSEAMAEYKNALQKWELQVADQIEEQSVLEEEMNQVHGYESKAAMQKFNGKNKLGSAADETKYETALKTQIEDYFKEWKNSQMNSYQNLKDIEKERVARLLKVDNQKVEEIKKIKNETESNRTELNQQFDNKTKEMAIDMEHIKYFNDEQIKKMQEVFNAHREEAEKEKQKLLEKLEKQKEEIKKNLLQQQNIFNQQIEKLNNDTLQRENLAKAEIEARKQERLDDLKRQKEERQIEFERQMQIEEKREQAMADQRKFDRDQMEEQRKIYEETRKADAKEREIANQERREANQQFQMEMQRAREDADRRQKEAHEQRAHEMNMMMMRNESLPSSTLSSVIAVAMAMILFIQSLSF